MGDAGWPGTLAKRKANASFPRYRNMSILEDHLANASDFQGEDEHVAKTQPSKDNRYRAPALDKGLDILELLARQAQGLTRSEIVKEMQRSPSEIYRMLERLVARDYVVRSPAGDRYALSLKLFALANMHPPLSRLIYQALPVMDAFSKRAEQSCHMGVYDRGNVLIIAQINSPHGWSFSLHRGARVSLLNTASGHVLMAFSAAHHVQKMRAEHEPLDGEAPASSAQLEANWHTIQQQGYMQQDSQQYFGVVDIACPVLGPDHTALAALTCPYIRRIDRRPGPDLLAVRQLLQQAGQSLSLNHA